MKFPRALLSLALLAASAGCALAGATQESTFDAPTSWRWRRQIDFSRMLCNRQWFDIAEEVLARVESDRNIIGLERAVLNRDLGEFYADMAATAARGAGGMPLFIQWVSKGRDYYLKVIEYLAGKKGYEAVASDLRARVCWLSLSIAEGYGRFASDPTATDEDKNKHAAAAIRSFKAAIDEFSKTVGDRDAEVAAIKKREPPQSNRPAHDAWDKEYKDARAEQFRAHLFVNEARIRFARFLQEVKGSAAERTAVLKAAEADVQKLLYDFSGTPGAVQANLQFAIILFEQGPARDQDALDRLTDIWNNRRGSPARRLPCEAAYWTARIRLRQSKYKEAIDSIHELLKFRSGGAWRPEDEITTAAVENYLADNEDADAEDYDQKALAGAFLLMADAYADQAAKGERDKLDPKKVVQYYGRAYDLGSAVRKARRFVEAEYATKIETWRKKAHRPRTVEDLQTLVTNALRDARGTKDAELKKRKYLEAARLLAEVLNRGDIPLQRQRDNWLLVGQCYYFAERYYEAYTVWTAWTRWYQRPQGQRVQAAQYAVGAAKKQFEMTKDPADNELLKAALLRLEYVATGEGGWRVVQKARELRGQGKYKEALEELKKVLPDNEAYPNALYEGALCHKGLYQRLSKAEQAGPVGQAELQKALDAFEQVLSEFKTRAPKLQPDDAGGAADDEKADKYQRLVDVAAASLVQLVNAHVSGLHPKADLNKAIELTDKMAERYPGIVESPYAPVLYLLRLRAPLELIGKAGEQDLTRLAAIVEESWEALKKYPEFEHLAVACATAAKFNTDLAKKLTDLAKTKPEAEQKPLLDRAKAADDRGLDLYLELLAFAPKQSLGTYYFVIYKLRERDTVIDARKIVTLADQALGLYDGKRLAAKDQQSLMAVKANLGLALCKTEKWNRAKEVLDALDTEYETPFAARLDQYKKMKAQNENDPARFPAPPPEPRRNATHREVREWLARAYLEAQDTQKYAKGARILEELGSDYRREKDRYLDLLYWLGETYRRMGNYEDVLNRIGRAQFTWPDEMKGKKYGPRFRELVGAVRRDLDRISDPARKTGLIKITDEMFTKLRE